MGKNKNNINTNKTGKIIIPLTCLAILFWFLESFIHAFVLHEGDFISRLLATGAHETWMRLLVVSILAAFGLYVQHTINKLKKVEKLKDISERKQVDDVKNRLQVEKTIADISARFVGIYDTDEAVNEALAGLAAITRADRSYLFLLNEDGSAADNTHEWCAPGTTPQIDNLQELPMETFPWWMEKLDNEKIIHVTDVSKLPPEAAAEKKILESQDIKSLLVFPVYIGAESAGFIGLDNLEGTWEWRDVDIAILRTSAEIIGNALNRSRGEKALQESEAQLKTTTAQLQALASHLEEVREKERIQVARELHDELSAMLTVLKMGVVEISNRLTGHRNKKDFTDLIEKAGAMESNINESVQVVRRIITRLRPGILDDLGLIPAIEWLTGEFRESYGMDCKLNSSLNRIELNRDQSTAVFRIFQEVLFNAARHARATRLDITLKKTNGCFKMEVQDNGCGIKKADIHRKGSFGLMGIRERAKLYGWTFDISGAADEGTKASLTIPFREAKNE